MSDQLRGLKIVSYNWSGELVLGWVFFYANGFFSYAHSGVGVLLGYGFLFLCL